MSIESDGEITIEEIKLEPLDECESAVDLNAKDPLELPEFTESILKIKSNNCHDNPLTRENGFRESDLDQSHSDLLNRKTSTESTKEYQLRKKHENLKKNINHILLLEERAKIAERCKKERINQKLVEVNIKPPAKTISEYLRDCKERQLQKKINQIVRQARCKKKEQLVSILRSCHQRQSHKQMDQKILQTRCKRKEQLVSIIRNEKIHPEEEEEVLIEVVDHPIKDES